MSAEPPIFEQSTAVHSSPIARGGQEAELLHQSGMGLVAAAPIHPIAAHSRTAQGFRRIG